MYTAKESPGKNDSKLSLKTGCIEVMLYLSAADNNAYGSQT